MLQMVYYASAITLASMFLWLAVQTVHLDIYS